MRRDFLKYCGLVGLGLECPTGAASLLAGESKELPPWGSAVAGATGAVLANALVYPLDMYVPWLSFSAIPTPSSKGHDSDSL